MLVSIGGGRAFAADLPGDPILGREIAERQCAECHIVAPGEDVVLGGLPTFQMMADDPSATETSLRVFLQTPHGEMPDIVLSRDQTSDLIAYILGLKSR
ncbi:MAG: hypothetical protein KIT00_01775 [Rhodospirillales bacterium]|nr:hypothetical protein [Rhodospirillales bacterium]